MRTVFAHCPGDGATLIDDQVVADGDVGKNGRPETGFVIVHDSDVDHPAIHHFEQVLGFEDLIGGSQDGRWGALAVEFGDQGLQVLEVAARIPDNDIRT